MGLCTSNDQHSRILALDYMRQVRVQAAKLNVSMAGRVGRRRVVSLDALFLNWSRNQFRKELPVPQSDEMVSLQRVRLLRQPALHFDVQPAVEPESLREIY